MYIKNGEGEHMIKSKLNYLSKQNFLNVKSIFDNNFPWFYHTDKVVVGDKFFQFTHIFVHEYKVTSIYFNKLHPLINKLKPKFIRAIKANLTFKNNKIKKSTFHTDFNDNDKNMRTAVYYVNSNNGFTVFKNGKKEKSVENKLVTFPVNLEHAGTTHTDTLERIVININYSVH